MKFTEKLKEYIWLINIIHTACEITFDEIQKKWLNTELSGGVELAKSTFHRHKDAIADIFGIYIDCNKKNGFKYFISNAHVLGEDTVQNWILSTLSVSNTVSESRAVQDRILLEKIPCADYLQIIIDAMKKKVRIKVTYRKYNTDTSSNANFEPYCIKLFKQRWYVLGHFHHDATPQKEERDYFATYSFDRIIDVKLTDIKFEIKSDFDANAYFCESYGVFVKEQISPIRIVLRVYERQCSYIRDLPLHSSQEEIAQGDNYADFAYYVRPTPDFMGCVMSFGKSIKVLEPKTFADDVKKELLGAVELYK